MSEWLATNKIKLAVLSLVVGNILVWGFFFSQPDGKLHLKFYNVGQGDSIFLETSTGYKILIDGGPDNKVLGYLGADLPFYSNKVDLLILTHPQADHLAGLLEVVKRYKIKTLWVSNGRVDSRLFKDWEQLLSQKEIRPVGVFQGDRLLFPDRTEIGSCGQENMLLVAMSTQAQLLFGFPTENLTPYLAATPTRRANLTLQTVDMLRFLKYHITVRRQRLIKTTWTL
ncbi:MAG: S-layer protein [Candidatus Woesebacteria bacterium GW2011_GWA1_45_8]|uniref:S-layer protein n=1 Tax=Candidatus Woesebacteria bacterium GW2011_GWA1_45_8 TaxID=1618559 RepID=A0A0G1MV84_9BACT|nr:MAG: S-layer protein [Candidatus Woesebacteria bacterium GW2011_GWA1_45_8]